MLQVITISSQLTIIKIQSYRSSSPAPHESSRFSDTNGSQHNLAAASPAHPGRDQQWGHVPPGEILSHPVQNHGSMGCPGGKDTLRSNPPSVDDSFPRCLIQLPNVQCKRSETKQRQSNIYSENRWLGEVHLISCTPPSKNTDEVLLYLQFSIDHCALECCFILKMNLFQRNTSTNEVHLRHCVCVLGCFQQWNWFENAKFQALLTFYKYFKNLISTLLRCIVLLLVNFSRLP